MARKLPNNPFVPRPSIGDGPYLVRLVPALVQVLLEIVQRSNAMLPADGTEGMSAPLVLNAYTVSTVPTAGDYTGGLIYVSDETGGATVAFSDGTNWRRVQDRVIVS